MLWELLLPTILFLPTNLDPFVWLSMLALPHLPFLP